MPGRYRRPEPDRFVSGVIITVVIWFLLTGFIVLISLKVIQKSKTTIYKCPDGMVLSLDAYRKPICVSGTKPTIVEIK